MKDAALMLFGAFVLLAPAAFFWINSRDRKAAEKKWQRLDQALAACEIASHAAHEETPSAARIDADDRKIIESAKRRKLLTEHLSLRKHEWHTYYSLNDLAKSFRWAGMYPDEEETPIPHNP